MRLAWKAVLGVAMCVACGGVGLAQSVDAGQQGAPPPFAPGRGGRMVRGTVTAIGADKMTLKTETGETFDVAVSANTQVRKDRQPVKLADVHVGDGVGAMGEVDPATKTVHALFLMVVDAEQVKKAKESFGKTWIAGKVTAINELKITVMRSDNVSQTIAVDEDTSFKRGGRGMQAMMAGPGSGMGMGMGGPGGGGPRREGTAGAGQPPPPDGESITLADVKVGDLIAGQGALKGGVFVPTELRVADPAAMRGQRRRQGDAAQPGAATPPSGSQPDREQR